MAQDWEIKARADHCTECQTAFEDKATCYSVLVFGEEGYRRSDFCERCWPDKESSMSPYSSWQGIFHKPPPPEEEPLKKETAETLLRKLIEEEDESRRNVIYILAVMLERKKQFVERDVQIREDGTKVLMYEHKKTGEMFVIVDPRLKLGELEPVQQEVIAMLGGGGNAEPGADPAAGTVPAAAEAGKTEEAG